MGHYIQDRWTTGQEWKNSTCLSIAIQWNQTSSYTTFISYTLYTTEMKLTEIMKRLWELPRYIMQNCTSLQMIWQWTKLLFSLKRELLSDSLFLEKDTYFGIKVFKLFDSTGYIFNIKVYFKDRLCAAETWAQVVYGQFFLCCWLIWWSYREENIHLWDSNSK